MYTLIAGVAVKIALNYILVGIPGYHIHGGPVASLACYAISMLPNIFFVLKYTGMRFQWKEWLLQPALATAVMGLVVLILRSILPVSHFTTLLEVAVGVAVFFAAALFFKALTREDLASFRRGKKAA